MSLPLALVLGPDRYAVNQYVTDVSEPSTHHVLTAPFHREVAVGGVKYHHFLWKIPEILQSSTSRGVMVICPFRRMFSHGLI